MSRKDYCTVVPDRWKDYDMSGCCKLHDEAYEEGTNRAKADKDFFMCLRATCNPWIAWTYYIGVRVFGWIPWIIHMVRKRLNRG